MTKEHDKNKNNDKTLRALLTLAGFALGASSVVAWNNRKAIQEKALDASERAKELKEKTIVFTENVKEKFNESAFKNLTLSAARRHNLSKEASTVDETLPDTSVDGKEKE